MSAWSRLRSVAAWLLAAPLLAAAVLVVGTRPARCG